MYVNRPIPCGNKYSSYAHYGLIDSLLGTGIGAISKDVRYHLDKLVSTCPKYFKNSVLNIGDIKCPAAQKFAKFTRDFTKWRWNLIKAADNEGN